MPGIIPEACGHAAPHHCQMVDLFPPRFALSWVLLMAVAAGMGHSPLAGWATMAAVQLLLAAAERLPALQHSPAAQAQTAWHRMCIRLHVPLQAGLLAWGLWLVESGGLGVGSAVALGLAAGGVTGSQGITFAHELGHARSRLDRVLGWLLMGSVCYAHFMVEHYRGHHSRAATWDDPATARRGESLWRFLPRTLVGSWQSAWRLEAQQLARLKRGWGQSSLFWATLAQAVWLCLLALWLGPVAMVFWLVQSAYAVFLLESINYVEHYGLQRGRQGSWPEPFGVMHAWNADHLLTNAVTANLQRHSDHHMHAWKPFPELEPLPGPQLPTGYAGCIYLAAVPPVWFAVMHRRLDALAA
jgi:alkane 1-monooxygenase